MFIRDKSAIEVLNCNVETEEISTIKSAKLIYIEGKSVLTTRSYSIKDSYYGIRYLTHIMLNGIPIVQINSPGCPTCNSLLATGYGIENANCQELNDVQAEINAPFVSLDASIEALTPLLALLKSGLYIIADAECYPTDGNGNFFWDTPNEPTENPATAAVLLTDADYTCISGQPIYLYPTQDTDCYTEGRVNHYIELFKKTDNAPRTVVYCFGEFINFILDGHHKACAAAALKKPLDSILIIPFSGYGYKPSKGELIPESLFFSSIKVPLNAVAKKYRPDLPKWIDSPRSFHIASGTISHRTWEARYTESANCYPSVHEYSNIVAAGVPVNVPVSDELIAGCMANLNDGNQQKMLAVLLVLANQKDSRLKHIAMLCAQQAPSCRLKQQAYRILAKIKADSEFEQLFVNYLVECEDKHDPILPIANSYWE